MRLLLLTLQVRLLLLTLQVKFLNLIFTVLGVKSKWDYFVGSDVSEHGKSSVIFRKNKETGIMEVLDEKWQPKA